MPPNGSRKPPDVRLPLVGIHVRRRLVEMVQKDSDVCGILGFAPLGMSFFDQGTERFPLLFRVAGIAHLFKGEMIRGYGCPVPPGIGRASNAEIYLKD